MAEGTAGIPHMADPLVSAALKLLLAALVVQIELAPRISNPSLVWLQESSGENLLAFATAVLCWLMTGKQVYVGIFRGGFQVSWSAKRKKRSPSYCHNRLITSLELICLLRHWENNMTGI